MIQEEEIKMSQDITNALTTQDRAVLVCTVNEGVETRLLIGGEERDVDNLLERISLWAERTRAERRKRI